MSATGRVADLDLPEQRRGPWRPRHVWVALAAALTGIGIAGSVFAAGSIAQNAGRTSQKSFERTAADIASTLRLTLQHENDLVVSAGSEALEEDLSQAAFERWTVAAQAFTRYPELQSIGLVVIVPASQLAAYAARAVRNPAGPLNADGTFSIVPAGRRPFYCLTVTGRARSAASSVPAGFDSCAGTNGVSLLGSRDSGVGTYEPFRINNRISLGIQTPIYTGGTVPSTTAARRAAFVGWVGTLTDSSVLSVVLNAYPNLSSSLRYRGGNTKVTFTGGHAATGSHTFTTKLGDGWVVTTSGAVAGTAISDEGSAVALLVTGVVLSVLAGLFVLVLGTGRARARTLVGQRTGQLLHQALHDSLTGLPNRALVMDRIEQLLVRGRRNATTGFVLYLDVDEFKNVNDTLGHQAGDRLLVAIADRLTSTLRGVDTIARMGGDEFVVLLDGGTEEVGPQAVAERVMDVMRQPFELDGASLPLMVTVSIGIATNPGATAVELLRDADIALYHAKAMGRNRYETFDVTWQTKINRRTALEFDLRSALSEHQYRLVYQPIYSLDDLTVTGVEGLLRWDHPTRGIVSPDEFIPILEQTGQIQDVGRWVLHTACAQMAAWHADGHLLSVSVNVSGRQLDHDRIVGDVADALALSGLPAAALIIEVTETVLMRNAEASTVRLNALKAMGVRIAVDDFGTGYSSLANLRQLPVDLLKIDRAFIQSATSSREARALINTLVQLGKDLGLVTLAEGVETTEQMDVLRGAHVDQAQGFLMSSPLDPNSVETQLLAQTRARAPIG